MGVEFQSKIFQVEVSSGNLARDIVSNNTEYNKTVIIEYFSTGSYVNANSTVALVPWFFYLLISDNNNNIIRYINCNTGNTCEKISEKIVLKKNQKIRVISSRNLYNNWTGKYIVQYKEEIRN